MTRDDRTNATSTSLEDKVALVTGAARGIGRGIAVALAEAGARVVVSDLGEETDWSYALSGESEIGETLRQVEKRSSGSLALPCDVTDPEQVAKLFETARTELGRIDLVVNNAGLVHFAPLAQFEEKLWDRLFEVNVKGVFLVCRAAIPSLVESGGNIVNIASVAGKRGYPAGSAYCGTKFAVVGITQALAAELGPVGVRVNAVCPGILDTAMWRDHLSQLQGLARGLEAADAFDAAVQEMIPLHRPQTAEDVAGAVVYLAQAPNVTGVALNVAGGMEVW